MDDYLQIRLLHRDGLSARDIARRLRCGRDTVRKALLNASPPGYTQTAPRACPKLNDAFQNVTVKAYLNEIVIVHHGTTVARHARGRTPGQQVLEPLHCLSVLGRKPASLDKTRLFAEWKLPATFMRLRSVFEQRHGPRTGARHYIRVLQLLAGHSVEAVEGAIMACEHRQVLTAEIIIARLAGSRSASGPTSPLSIPIVHVPLPDLRRFDRLLFRPQGEPDERDVTKAQPQDAEAADDAERACPAGA